MFCFKNHYSIPLSPYDGMCRPGLACVSWSGTIHYAESILLVFSWNGSNAFVNSWQTICLHHNLIELVHEKSYKLTFVNNIDPDLRYSPFTLIRRLEDYVNLRRFRYDCAGGKRDQNLHCFRYANLYILSCACTYIQYISWIWNLFFLKKTTTFNLIITCVYLYEFVHVIVVQLKYIY